LEAAKAGNHGRETIPPHARRLLLSVERACVPLLALTPGLVQTLEEGEDGLEVFAALKLLCVHRWGIHTVMMPTPRESCTLASPLTEDVKI
jgi:hypothetical protein